MKKRVLYFDILKAIAIFFVIFIHVISEYWDNLNVDSINFVILSLLDSISRFCVPIYFMVSGALFLNEEKTVTIKDVFKKYVPKVFILYVFWNLIYNFINIIMIKKSIITLNVIRSIIIDTLLGNGLFHLYFLPIIIIFYLSLPILKQITKKENKNILKYFVFLLFIFLSFNKILDYLFDINILYPFLFDGYLIYFILGYYLNTFDLSKKKTNTIYILGIVGFIITFLGTVICSKEISKTEVFFKYISFNVVMYSSAFFLFAKNNFYKINEKVLNILSKTNFGMYLIHGIVLGFMEYIGMFKLLDKISIPVSVIINTIIIYILSFITVFISLKIPAIKYLFSLERNK